MTKKILIIDDDQNDLQSMKNILEKEGYGVVGADNGATALDKLKGNGFDLILLDIKMPTLSGYDLLRLLREKLNHKVKMFYVSIIPQKEVSMEDIDGFIQKPFSPEDLIQKVKEAIR